MTRGYVTMLRKSWSPKNRARTIVVLVYVFVFLPLIGSVSSLARTSAEAAVRYYAEAIAQGRFEDALSVETDRGRNDSSVTHGSVVDLRRAQVAAPSSVSAVRMYSGRDVRGRQRAAIDFSVNGSTVTREIYVENTASLRLHVGPWRIAEGAAREETVRTEGYATEVTVGGVSLGSVGGTTASISISASDDLWHPDHHDHEVYAYPGVYVIGVTQLSEHTEYSVDSVAGASAIEMGTRAHHQVDITVDEETHAWHQERFAALATACLRGEKPEEAVCHTQQYHRADSINVGEISGDQREGLSAPSIQVTTGNYETTVGLKSEVCFDQSGERRIVFRGYR